MAPAPAHASAAIGSRLPGVLPHPGTPPYTRRVTPDATARLVALPDPLRAWAREFVRFHLGVHITRGLP